MIFLSFLLTISCTPQTNKRIDETTSSDSVDEQVDTEDDSSSNSTSEYIEFDDQVYSSTFYAPSSFSDTINIKGSTVNNYIENNSSTIYCAIAHFPSVGSGTSLVVAGLPRTKTNLSTGKTENYISLNFKNNDKSLNTSFCQKTAVNQLVNSLNIGSIVYSVEDLCPTCANQNQRSNSIEIISSDGEIISSFDGFNLSVELVYSSSDTTIGGCQTDSECSSSGFDCCISGQCVNDGELKKTYSSGDPEYSDFLAALIDVANNSSNITKYPQFYFICGEVPADDIGGGDNDDDDELSAEEQAQQNFLSLKYLYECTTPVNGEQSICTSTYNDITADDVLFRAGDDDRDFSSTYTGTLQPAQAILEVIYQNETIYSNGTYSNSASDLTFAGTNDVLTSASLVTINKSFDDSSKYKSAHIRYAIDGSCTEINSNLASCYKTYIQGQNDGLTTDHFPASNEFLIPTYRDTSKSIIVEVDGIKMSENQDYVVINSTPSYIRFIDINTCATPSTPSLCPVDPVIRVLDTQELKITFSVDQGSDPVMESKKIALQKIGEICVCPNNDCTLEPVRDNNDTIVNYACVPPASDTSTVPLQQLVQISSKRSPHLHFNTTGLYKADLTQGEIISDPINEQEGLEFEYTDLNPLQPNNQASYIGFNEIYGSFNYGVDSALPAKEVFVDKGTTYDISVTKGSFANCYNCGYDYYSNLVRLFPENLTYSGGGFKPDYESSSKLNASTYRADEMAFGRSCYVPTTMIPWGHEKKSVLSTQRRDRLSAQHFLFANGYQRDWYGFDYGALIGSFDGVKWFAIGNARRIKAKSNRLFLAFNAYFADQTLDNSSFNVLVQDSVINGDVEFPETDIATTGAQCQQAYICEKDSDCAATLGWEYACEKVSSIKGKYPRFDDNGKEIPFTEEYLNLATLVSRYEGSSKRCVYRGRGALCTQGYDSVVASNTYSQTDEPRHHACSANTYCQPFTDTNGDVAKFNNRINRIPRSIFYQNSQLDASEYHSSVGLISPIIGRPLDYVGSETIDPGVKNSLNANNNSAICLPGKVNSATYNAGVTPSSLNDAIPQSSNASATSNPSSFIRLNDNAGDVIHGIGKTASSVGIAHHLACPVFDTSGNDVRFSYSSTDISTRGEVHHLADAQNLSTEVLDKFSSLIDTAYIQNYEQSISASGNSADDDILANDLSYEKNSCLRAPGSTCFTDLDCAANNAIVGTLTSVTTGDLAGLINEYELLFWQSKMVCSQPATFGEADYDVRKNRCCREVNNEIKYPTVNNDSSTPLNEDGFTTAIYQEATPLTDSVNTRNTDPGSYSGNTLTHYHTNRSSDTLNNLKVASVNACNDGNNATECATTTNFEKQFRTVDTMAARSCCSENWIRNFSETQGGGHTWSPSKFQQIDTSAFECLNYYDLDGDGTRNNSVDCADPLDPNCEAISIPETKANIILEWLSKMELVGIPNVMIPVIDKSVATSNFKCSDDLSGGDNYLSNFINTANTDIDYDNNSTGSTYDDTSDDDGLPDINDFLSLYSVETSATRYSSNIKTVFSPDSFSCCLPGGSILTNTQDDQLCCTGNTTPVGANSKRCTLPNYSDISVYLNRFVSSEANSLDESNFDSKTGFIKDNANLLTIACTKGLCPSGTMAKGIIYGKYGIPGLSEATSDNTVVNRFAQGQSDNFIGSQETGVYNYIDAGLKFNNHYYCIPSEVASSIEEDYEVVRCN